jgi:hypothetical protein
MNCQKVRENLWEYEHQQLGTDVGHEITEHLSLCPSCSVQLQQLKQVEAELDCLIDVEPSAYFDQKLNARLNGQSRSRAVGGNRLFSWFSSRYALSFLLLLLTTAGAWIGFRHQQARSLNSLEDVLEVQDRYLGSSESLRTSDSPSQATTSSQQAARSKASDQEEEIPEGDLAVLKNYDLLQNYDFLKNFDLADLEVEDQQRKNGN